MPCSFIYAGQTIVNKHSQQNNQQNPVSQMPTQTEVNAPVTDPYALFLAEQQKREAIWSVNRAAKKPKTADVESLTTNTPTKRNDSVATQTPGVNRAAKKPKTADVESLTTNTPTKRNDSVATQTPGAKTLTINVATQTSPTLQQSDELSLLKRELQERDKRLFKVRV